MDMQLVHGHAVLDMDMQHGHGHAAWTWSHSMDLDTQHRHRHTAFTWTCRGSLDMDKQFWHWQVEWTLRHIMYLHMQHGHGRVAWTWTCSMDMDMQHEKDMQPWHGHSIWTFWVYVQYTRCWKWSGTGLSRGIPAFFVLLPDWNYRCRNASVSVTFLDADDQLLLKAYLTSYPPTPSLTCMPHNSRLLPLSYWWPVLRWPMQTFYLFFV